MNHIQFFTIKVVPNECGIRDQIRRDYDPECQAIRAEGHRDLEEARRRDLERANAERPTSNAERRIEPGETRNGIRNNGDSAIFVGVA